jgi:hypothetical protein
MATVNKDFKVKYGLVVEGATGTINGVDILTKSEASDDYIIDLIGGETLITSVKSDDFTVTNGELTIAAGSDIARDGDITSAIDALTTKQIEEDQDYLYFTTARVDSHLSGGDGISYNAGTISAYTSGGSGITIDPLTGIVVDRTTVDTWYDANGAAGDVATDLSTHENATEAHGATGAVVGTTNTQTLSNKTLNDPTIVVGVGLGNITITNTEIGYLDGVTSGIQDQLDDKAPLESPALTGTPTAPTAAAGTNSTQVATTAYTDAAVAALVDGAPDLLNTLNELAAALDDNPDVISDLQDIAAGKQDALTAGANIDITEDVISVTGLDTADVAEDASRLYFTDTRAVSAVVGLNDSSYYPLAEKSGKAGVFKPDVASELASESINGSGITTTGANSQALAINRTTVDTWYDAAGSAATAETNANSYTDDEINALDTDDIEEGSTNLYYTDYRATQAAATLLTGATKTNIEITGDGSPTNPLVITAENGVADSDTDDLTEGTTNLYFTDERAVDALEAVVPNFTAVEINSVAKQVAATLEAATAGIQTAYQFAKADYRSAEFLVKVAYGTHTEISKVLLTLDTSDNIAITEYAIIGTNGSASTISADVSIADQVRLLVTTANNNSTVTVMGTLLA